ncbi:2-dehydropantoate 2-reductase [Polycladidibacter stylochi]|uniref:2-dehydropantoate 2-reductase n=1 Tax=Polycladidibacter stylochi TaxID=1807766 RepID=UPI0008302F6B|nr:2-dehydropantoate 2-reductase [Pseudovibrio stylochi]
MKKILIIGAGGVGGYLGARMAEVGLDVSFLVRGKRLEQLRSNGLVYESVHGGGQVNVNTVTKDDDLTIFDFIVVATKAYHLNDDLIELLKKASNGSNYVIPFLNGLSHMDLLESVFGRSRTMGGLCRIATTLTDDGTVKHLNDAHEYVIGGRTPESANAAAQLVEAMKEAKIIMKTTDDVDYSMWEKAYSLSVLAAATCLMRAPLGCINSSVGGRQFIEQLTKEAASIASAYGYTPKTAFYKAVLQQQTDQSSALTASMLRDLEAGGQIENDHIIGDLYYKGCAAGLDLPLFGLAKIHLEAYELRKARHQ